MNYAEQILETINSVFTKRKHPQPLNGLGDSNTCIPFYQFNAQDVLVYYQTSLAANLWSAIWNAAQQISGYGTMISLLTKMDNAINAGTKATQYSQYIMDHYKESNRVLQWKMDCHLPYCEIATWLTTIDVNGTFYAPEMQMDLKRKFFAAGVAYQNARLRTNSHIQRITSITQVTPEDYNGVPGFPPGALMIKIPNIEFYWLGDQIKIDGVTDPCTILMRHGYTEGKKMTAKAADHMRDYRNICHGLFDGSCGEYCNEGWNLPNLQGEGTIVVDKQFSQLQSFIKSTTNIRLVNTKIIDTTPPANKNNTPAPTPPTGNNTTPPAGNTPTKTINDPTPAGTSLASFTTPLTILLLLGVGAGFIYQAFKDDDQPEYAIVNSETNNSEE